MPSLSAKEDAVSPVIATILIVGMTAALIAIFFAVVMGMTSTSIAAPIVGLSINLKGNDIVITHLNGAELPVGSYKIIVDNHEISVAELDPPNADLTPGKSVKWDSGTGGVDYVSVVYVSGEDSVLIVQKYIGKK